MSWAYTGQGELASRKTADGVWLSPRNPFNCPPFFPWPTSYVITPPNCNCQHAIDDACLICPGCLAKVPLGDLTKSASEGVIADISQISAAEVIVTFLHQPVLFLPGLMYLTCSESCSNPSTLDLWLPVQAGHVCNGDGKENRRNTNLVAKQKKQDSRFLPVNSYWCPSFCLCIFLRWLASVLLNTPTERGFVGLDERSHEGCILPGRPPLPPPLVRPPATPFSLRCKPAAAAFLSREEGSRRPMAPVWDELSPRLDWASIQQRQGAAPRLLESEEPW